MDEFAITSKLENIERRLDDIERKANDPFDGQERQIEELKRQTEIALFTWLHMANSLIGTILTL